MASDKPLTLSGYFDVARRRWVYLATILPAAILIAVYIAYTLPVLYRSSATIMLEASSIPENLIRTTVRAYADEQLQRVRRGVMTNQNLLAIAEDLNPYPLEPDLSPAEELRLLRRATRIERVDPITLEPLPQSDAFSIHYVNPDPELAMRVTKRLSNMFLHYNRKTRAEQAEETYKFLQAQSEQTSKVIDEAERRIAAFKEKYGNALPESRSRNQHAMDRVVRDLETLQQRILLANDRKRTLELELNQINPNLFDPAGDWRAELAALRAELAAAQQRYTADHPDVRRLRRSIDALAARVDESEPETLAPDNPDYIKAASALETAKAELAALQSSAARAREQMQEYELSLQIAPEVEREFSQLLRDYDTARERFRDIEASLSKAALGQELESEARGERLIMIRGANMPYEPYSPNRLGIILLGVVLGGGLAMGLMALVEASDPTIRSLHDLGQITDIKPLATVPFIANVADARKRALAWGAASVVGVIALVFVGSTVMRAAV